MSHTAFHEAFREASSEAFREAFSEAFHEAFREAFHEAFREAFCEAFHEAFREAFCEAFREAFREAFKVGGNEACSHMAYFLLCYKEIYMSTVDKHLKSPFPILILSRKREFITFAPASARSTAAFYRKRPPISQKVLHNCFLVIVLSFTSLHSRHFSCFVFVWRTLLFVVVSFCNFSLLRPRGTNNPSSQTICMLFTATLYQKL